MMPSQTPGPGVTPVAPVPLQPGTQPASPTTGPSVPASPNLTHASGSFRTSIAPTLISRQHTQVQGAGIPPKPPSPTPSGAKLPPKRGLLIRAFAFYFVVVCIFIFVCLITFYGKSTNWVLARLNPTSGILLLSFLSKMIDWGLTGTTGKAWTMLQWGPILRRGRGREKNMLTFLTLGARFDGYIKILFSRAAWTKSRLVNCAGLWALLRLFILVLVQFPGLIIMAVVEPQTQYRAENFANVSGGIGIFDSSTIFQQIEDPAVTNLIFTILEDPRFTFRSEDAITPECQSTTSCQSYLMTGGLTNINPLPPRQKSNDKSTAYIAKDVPSYQLDTWDLSYAPLNFTFGDCQLYNAVNSSLDLGFHLCMRNEPDGAVLAGYAPCYNRPGPGSCQTNATTSTIIQLTSSVTKIIIHRLKTTFTADHRSGILLSAQKSPSSPPPTLQRIQSTDLRTAIDNLLCPVADNPDNPTNSACLPQRPNYLLTDSISTILASSITLEYSTAQSVLQNLLTTSIYLFTPVWRSQLGSESLFRDTIVEGLPAENYFEGSLARPVVFVAPVRWTVVAFMVTGAVLLGFVGLGMGVSVGGGGPGEGETSSFPFVDAGRVVVEDFSSGSGGQVKGLTEVFKGGMEDGDVVRVAAGLGVRVQ